MYIEIGWVSLKIYCPEESCSNLGIALADIKLLKSSCWTKFEIVFCCSKLRHRAQKLSKNLLLIMAYAKNKEEH